MKKILIFLTFILVPVLSFSQAVIQFENKVHDFGTINEADGKVRHEFTFKNVGNSPLVINNVRASCGCTAPTWTKTPVEPGRTGSIIAVYNPAGRKGAFSSSITVTSNAAENQERLSLRGSIVPKMKDPDTGEAIGALRLNTKTIQLNNVYKGKTQSRSITVKNTNDAPVTISFGNLPEALEVKAVPEVLERNQEGIINVTLNASKCEQWGEVSCEFYVQTNDRKTFSNENKIQVVANIVEDFASLSIEERRNTPILELGARNLDLGTLKTNSKRSNKISVRNSGQNSLEIRRIVNKNAELTIKPEKASIGSGKKTEIKVELNTRELKAGNYKKTISLQTNDPQNSFITVDIIWQITE
ncbi:MAG: DUF1573 domain-containing protein [Prevotellaceae bacterium]|jgi:hypothetical protein|nr:DUF1573 domain-containing protein [Prevotellaceae bacterium]